MLTFCDSQRFFPLNIKSTYQLGNSLKSVIFWLCNFGACGLLSGGGKDKKAFIFFKIYCGKSYQPGFGCYLYQNAIERFMWRLGRSHICCWLVHLIWWAVAGLVMRWQGCATRWSLGARLRGNGERMRKLKENDSLHFLILSPFPPSLSISASKFVTFCRKMLKYGTFVANVTKILTYALWGNNSGSN